MYLHVPFRLALSLALRTCQTSLRAPWCTCLRCDRCVINIWLTNYKNKLSKLFHPINWPFFSSRQPRLDWDSFLCFSKFFTSLIWAWKIDRQRYIQYSVKLIVCIQNIPIDLLLSGCWFLGRKTNWSSGYRSVKQVQDNNKYTLVYM